LWSAVADDAGVALVFVVMVASPRLPSGNGIGAETRGVGGFATCPVLCEDALRCGGANVCGAAGTGVGCRTMDFGASMATADASLKYTVFPFSVTTDGVLAGGGLVGDCITAITGEARMGVETAKRTIVIMSVAPNRTQVTTHPCCARGWSPRRL
jgi:hypothetical protein